MIFTKQKTIIIITVILVIVGILIIKAKPESSSYQALCLQNGGKWLEQYKECENLKQEICLNNGGKYEECSSACRHAPLQTICTANCIKLCSW